ncbi:MAG: isopentenyl transferase family protein [Candidatus Shapirobacteria bacterium]
MNNKLLIISGPTASGKTALAIAISKLFPSELISADSRQIYIGLDIGVGKDHPTNTPIHCIDTIYPNEIYSVAQFQKLAMQKISEVQSRGHLPIVVGCTAFYIKSLLANNYQTFDIKPNYFLRFFLDRLPVFVLQKIYYLLDKTNYILLNNSDVHNPRRLIRKIEIKLSHKSFISKFDLEKFDILHISLTAPNSFLYPRVDARVEDRLTLGHMDELKMLLKKYSWNDPGLKVSAYHSFKNYIAKLEPITTAIQKWKFAEHHDVSHHKRAFSTIKNANFVDISKPTYPQSTIKFISKWYNQL